MSSQVFVRAALAADVDAIRDLLAPEVEAGTILPRVVRPEDFLVALLDGEIVAAVAMTRWTDDVVELGSLVSARPGLGLGRAMVQAVLKKAALEQFRRVVALTAIDGWFTRLGFRAHPTAPWALASDRPVLVTASDDCLDAAVGWKASTVCAGCARLGRCRQHMVVHAVASETRRVA